MSVGVIVKVIESGSLPSERVVDTLDKLEIVDGITPQCRREWHREVFEGLQMISQIDALDVVDDVQERHTGTGISGCLAHGQCHWLDGRIHSPSTHLVGKPKSVGTAIFLLLGIIFAPAK